MINISFDFDEVTQKITNLTVASNGQVQTSSKRKKRNGDQAILEVDENKLILSEKLVTLLGIDAGTRVTVNYYTLDNQNTIPLIGKSELFADKDMGNKLTKSNTISFKGSQKDVLLNYGAIFSVEPWENKEGVFKLLPIESVDTVVSADSDITEVLTEEQAALGDLNTNDLDTEIKRLTLEDFPF